MQAGFHPATVPVPLNRLLNLIFCQCHWQYHHTQKESWPCKRRKTLTALTLFLYPGSYQGVMGRTVFSRYSESPSQSTSFISKGWRGKKFSGCVNWVWTWASAETKLLVQIWKVSQKHLWSHLSANSTWLCMCTEQEASLSWQRGCREMLRKNQLCPIVGNQCLRASSKPFNSGFPVVPSHQTTQWWLSELQAVCDLQNSHPTPRYTALPHWWPNQGTHMLHGAVVCSQGQEEVSSVPVGHCISWWPIHHPLRCLSAGCAAGWVPPALVSVGI